MPLRKIVIERDVPNAGSFVREQLRGAAAHSGEDDRIIRKHARISRFPATQITNVRKMIDPTTAA